jgi:ATP-dependent exoDNAse (exonuclease V) alpha subunit
MLNEKGNNDLKGTPRDPYDGYATAPLDSELLGKVQELEKELRAATKENVILIAYEDHSDAYKSKSPTTDEDVEVFRNNFCE